MRVLVGIDGSDNSFQAAAEISALLSPAKDQLALYFALREPQQDTPQAVEAKYMTRARSAMADAVFEAAANHLAHAWRGKFATITGDKRAARGLTTTSESWKADLIVVGARGLGGLASLLLGSVAKSVLHHSTTPVWISRPRRLVLLEGVNVLLACDGSEASRQANGFLSGFSWPEGSTGQLVQVIEPMLAGNLPDWLVLKARTADAEAMAKVWVAGHEQERVDALNHLTTAQKQLPELFQKHEPVVREGSAAEEILSAAEEGPIDLIVVGARGQGRWSRMMVGSTSETVVNHAACSVLVVRQTQ